MDIESTFDPNKLDPTSEKILSELYPDFAAKVRQLISDVESATGRAMKLTEGVRSMATAEHLYQMGRSIPGPNASEAKPLGDVVTEEQPGDSMHFVGAAVDCCFVGKDPYLAQVSAAESIAAWEVYMRTAEAAGMEAGGRWKKPVDKPHVQLLYGATQPEVRALLKAGGMHAVWSRFDQLREVTIGTDWAPKSTEGEENA